MRARRIEERFLSAQGDPSQEVKGRRKSPCFVRNDGLALEFKSEVVPAGIEGLDQRDLFFAPPSFDLFLMRDCRSDAEVRLKPNQLRDVVFLTESWH